MYLLNVEKSAVRLLGEAVSLRWEGCCKLELCCGGLARGFGFGDRRRSMVWRR